VAADLLGEGHAKLLDDLMARLAAIRQGDVAVSRVVVLMGASGTGKSRVVREVYRRLQAVHPAPGYWPPLGADTGRGHGAGVDPMPGRKVIGPSLRGFEWPPDALPSFGWWTFDCGRMPDGSLLDVIGQARPTIEAHLLPVRLAWRQAAGWPRRMQSQRTAIVKHAREALIDGSVEGAEQLLGDLAIPGLGLGLSWLRRGTAAVSRYRREQDALHENSQLMSQVAAQQESAAKELGELITAVAHSDVPAVIVVEDLHLMSSHFAEFLEIAAHRREGQPVLVIGTAWPEGLHNPPFDHWRRWAHAHGNLDVLSMPDLDQDDLLTVLGWYAPRTDLDTARRIVERYPNPLMLQLLCSVDHIQERIKDAGGRLDLTDDELADLPYTLRGLYEMRWAELPEGVQAALKAAAGAIPYPRFPYLPRVVAAAAEAAGLTDDGAEMHTNLIRATRDFAWSSAEDLADHSQFRESILGEIALEHLASHRREKLQCAVRENLAKRIDAMRGGRYWLSPKPEALHLAGWLTALVPPASAHSAAESTATIMTAHAVASVHQPAAAAAIMTQRDWIGPLEPEHPDTLNARNNVGCWLGQTGNLDEAFGLLTKLAVDQRRVLGPNHPDTQNTRLNLAQCLAETGKVEEALELMNELVMDQRQILGADHPLTLNTCNNLAYWLGQAGRLEEAIGLFSQLVTDRRRILGLYHHDTLNTRNNLAGCLAESGRIGEAVELHAELLIDEQRILGAEHPATLNTRGNLASCLVQAGRLDEALERFRQLLIDQQRILGPDHAQTLTTRMNLGYCLELAGQLDEALELFSQLLIDQQRILGTDHPATLTSGDNLARCLGRALKLEDAIELSTQVLADRQRILGPQHPDTLTSRSNIAYLVAQVGRVDEAIKLFSQLLIDRETDPGA
jgi:tetratricopeptide (TPR) repeat protein